MIEWQQTNALISKFRKICDWQSFSMMMLEFFTHITHNWGEVDEIFEIFVTFENLIFPNA